MIHRKLLLIATFVSLTACGLFFLNTPAVSQENCAKSACHAKLFQGKNVHSPAAQTCESCHEPQGVAHPQGGKQSFKLMQQPPALCAMCHPPFGTKSRVHPPVKDGMCTSCHSPHSSNEPKLLLQPLKDLCLTCHPDKVNFKYLHGPVSAGDCTNCHSPHESENKGLLLKEGGELCFTCHLDMQGVMKRKGVHPALLGGCTSCHNPHGAPHKKLLSAEGEKLCAQCHPKVAEKVEKAKVVHAPIKTEKGCASCHSPHASDTEKLLIATGKDLCLGCHKEVIRRNMTELHGPIKDKGCTPCHDPHGSQYAKLAVKEFPAEEYVPYTDKEYGLCFSCHNRDLLKYPATSFATGFRDGERNLHYLHVNMKQKGRTCTFCHNMHGSGNPKLIADSVPFGKWSLPLKFAKTETGGSCAPGCHKSYNYDRKTPGKGPEPVKPEEKKKGK